MCACELPRREATRTFRALAESYAGGRSATRSIEHVQLSERLRGPCSLPLTTQRNAAGMWGCSTVTGRARTLASPYHKPRLPASPQHEGASCWLAGRTGIPEPAHVEVLRAQHLGTGRSTRPQRRRRWRGRELTPAPRSRPRRARALPAQESQGAQLCEPVATSLTGVERGGAQRGLEKGQPVRVSSGGNTPQGCAAGTAPAPGPNGPAVTPAVRPRRRWHFR